MHDSFVTRPSLLIRIKDSQDADAWGQFIDIYSPLIYRFGRKKGLQDAAAADLTQDVLRAVSGAIERLNYEPRIGKFRGWLFTVAQNKLRDQISKRKRHPRGSGDTQLRSFLENQPDSEDALSALWDQEYDRCLFEWASDRVRPRFQKKTWDAFWQTSVEGTAARQVAEQLDITVGAVYIAKSRVLADLKTEIEKHIGD